MPAPTPRETAIAWFESVWQQRSTEAAYNIMAADAVAHQEGDGIARGPAEFMAFHNQILSAFPHLSLHVMRAVGDDSQACVHWRVSTNPGGQGLHDFDGGNEGCFSGMTFVTVKDGKIVEGWDCWDRSTFMAALLRKGDTSTA